MLVEISLLGADAWDNFNTDAGVRVRISQDVVVGNYSKLQH